LVVQPFWEEKTPFPLLFGCGEAALGKSPLTSFFPLFPHHTALRLT
jgi:hypothetical protein